MQIEISERISEKIFSLINSATESLIVLTGKLNEDLTNGIFRKAASGVKTTVIASDKNWCEYLRNLSANYGKDAEEKLRKTIKELNFKLKLYSRLKYVILVISTSILAVLFIRLGINLITLIISIILLLAINVTNFIILNKKEKNISNELAIENENLQRELEELKNIRERASRNLQVIVTEEISFTLIISDDKAIISSYSPNYSKNSFHYIQEINKDEALKIISFILNLSKS